MTSTASPSVLHNASPPSILAAAVSDLARLRRRARRRAGARASKRRLAFIEEYAPGRSFADIGGMYGIEGDIALRAEAAGASRVTLFDAGEPTPGFLERAAQQGSKIRCVQGDLEDPLSVREIGPHQIVWCAGVVYHTPNPVAQLINLRQLTTELLFLSSATIPEIPGFPQACVYYPYLDRRRRAPFARGVGNPAMSIGLGTPFDDRPMYGHANFWWGITPSALRAMVRTARFEIVEEIHGEGYPWGLQVIARPTEAYPSLPPADYYRIRGQRLREGRPPPFDGYYDKGPDADATPADIYPDMAGLPRLDLAPRFRRWRRGR